MIITQTCIP